MRMSSVEALPDSAVWKPWVAARRLFKVPPPAGNAFLGHVSAARSVLGLLTLLTLGRGDRSVADTLNEEGWQKAVTTVIVALIVLPVAIAVLYRRTYREFRPQLRLRPVVTRIILLLLTTYVAMTPIILVATDTVDLDAWKPTTMGEALLAFFGGLASIVYTLWVALYVGHAFWWTVRSSCFIGEYHPLLGPAVTTVVVTTTTAIVLIQFDTNGTPMSNWLILTLGGLTTTLILAAIEYGMLRRCGITWRTGSHPQPRSR